MRFRPEPRTPSPKKRGNVPGVHPGTRPESLERMARGMGASYHAGTRGLGGERDGGPGRGPRAGLSPTWKPVPLATTKNLEGAEMDQRMWLAGLLTLGLLAGKPALAQEEALENLGARLERDSHLLGAPVVRV